MSKYPVGFLSYVREDDVHARGKVTAFRKQLSGEVSAQTGEIFDIFQDRYDIGWGQNWRDRIYDSIDAGMLLICIITPRFFKSDACRDELERLLAREKELGRNDLIFPVYYITCPVLEDPLKRADDSLAQVISARNYVDWRQLRFEPTDSLLVEQRMAELASDICRALETRLPNSLVNDWGVSLSTKVF